MREREIIENVRRLLGPGSRHVRVGIGDDTAVLESTTSRQLLGSDLMIEGVHFDLRFCSPADVGAKALASALSDIAAMNGQARAALISLALPKDRAGAFITPFYEGIADVARRYGCDIVGGDLSSSPGPIFIDVACLGETQREITRAGAKAGDLLAVSGRPGASRAGLEALRTGRASDELRRAHLRPSPRFDLLSRAEFQATCTSLIDISDGIASEARHLALASGVGFEINRLDLPLHPDAIALGGPAQAFEWALHGGEDYELLATFSAEFPVPPGFTVIGRATTTVGDVTLVGPRGERQVIDDGGFDHFAVTNLPQP